MDDKLAKTIGAAARAARNACGLTQEDAADEVGVSTEFYARIERGRTLPSVPTLIRIAAALDVSADALLGLASGPRRSRSRARDPVASPESRRVIRRLLRARPSTLRLVGLLLRELDGAG